jgi:glycosyltransferase involved in cell wall biosynthesis
MKQVEKVSICMITYNHEKFIAQAIESVLSQISTFGYKLYIGEDVSTDTTRAICLAYQARFPDMIEVLPATKNLGAIRNFKRTIEACQGEYIAILEGDDYWIDPYKLQKQIDFLDSNPDFTVCYTNIYWLYPDGSQRFVATDKENRHELTIDDILENNYVATLTCVFRNKLFTLPPWFGELYLGDWPLNILNALHGNIKHLADVTGVYRVHATGIWSPLKSYQKEEYLVQMFELIQGVLPQQYHSLLQEKLKKKYYFLTARYNKEKVKSKSLFYYKKYCKSSKLPLLDPSFYKLTAKLFLLP